MAIKNRCNVDTAAVLSSLILVSQKVHAEQDGPDGWS
jgi:hypothetical protein